LPVLRYHGEQKIETYVMQYIPLADTGLEVSKICLGTMTYGRQNTEAEAHAQLDMAVDYGINFIDTAELYAVPSGKEFQGLTEQYIGTWIAKRGKRDDLIIATKITGRSAGLTYIRPVLDFRRAHLQEAVDKSLTRLQTDYIDLYQLHWPIRQTNFFGQRGYSHDPDDPWEDDFLDVLQSLDELIQSGKIRHFGVSNETPWGLMRMIHLADKHGLPRPVSIQNAYSLVNRTFEVGLAEVSIREDVPLLAYSPLAGGLLSGKYHDNTAKPENRFNQFKSFMARYKSEAAWKAMQRYIDLAAAHNLSPSQMALAYVNTRPFVGSNIIGATSLEQLKENIESIEVTLSRAVLKEIEKIQNEIPNPAP
jgi:aryl-alcohol dehydrogenase-like predicted oxidoreductase